MTQVNNPWDVLDQAFDNPKSPSNTSSSKMVQQVKDMTPLNGKMVLVVDSALATRRALQDQLSQLGAKGIVFASSVSEVEGHMAAREFALIICEYLLEGDRNGQQLLEELRVGKKLPFNTAFMMVTGERTYSNVVSVAEFEPDDYLIKPFTASALSARVIRIFNKKLRLARAYEAMYAENYDLVPAYCVELEREFPQYMYELERMRVESIFRSNRIDEALNELEEAMRLQPKPWMHLLLAKIKSEQKLFDDAEMLLSQVVRNNPEYISATDLYAEVLWEQNKPEVALEVLEKLGAKGTNSVTRLRKLADLAVRIGDDTRSKTYLTKVIDRSRNSSLTQMHDYLQLSKIYVKEGRHEDAEKLTAKMRMAIPSGELEFARALMAIQKQVTEGGLGHAKDKLEKLFDEHGELISKLAVDAQTSLLEQCLVVGMEAQGYDLARSISKRKPSKGVLDRIKFAMAANKQKALS